MSPRMTRNAHGDSLEHVLSLFGYHQALLATDPVGRFGLGLGVSGGPFFRVSVRIEKSDAGRSWDQVWFKIEGHPEIDPSEDYFPVGNRSGAEHMYAMLAVPIIEYAAANLQPYDEEEYTHKRLRRPRSGG